MSKLISIPATFLNVVGHTAAGVFLTNRLLMGAPERLPKIVLILGHLALWPLIGLLNSVAAGKNGVLRAFLWPRTPSQLWALLFSILGARWIAQEVYRKAHPCGPPAELLDTSVGRIDMRDAIAAHEGLLTKGVRGVPVRRNEMYDLEIVSHTVVLGSLPPEFDGFSMVQISDVHYGRSYSAEFIRRYVGLVLELQPDLVVLTGDYQTKSSDIEGAARLLSPLGKWSRSERGGRGTVAILGNHDREAGSAHITHALRQAGIPVLHNSHMELKSDDASLYITGVADPWSGRANLDIALHGIPAGACVILLAHVPDFLDTAAGRVDLMLAGHNHGGQIKVPVLGALLVSSRYGRRYVEGFYKERDTLMYVSRGIGGKPPIRLGSKPEIARMILRSTQGSPAQPPEDSLARRANKRPQ